MSGGYRDDTPDDPDSLTEEEIWEIEERRGDHNLPGPSSRLHPLAFIILVAAVVVIFILMFRNGMFMHGD